MHRIVIILLILLCNWIQLPAQETPTVLQQVSPEYMEAVSSKANYIGEKLDKKTKKTLSRIQKQEERMKRKLMKRDSLAAKNIFASSSDAYKQLEQRIAKAEGSQYIPKLDSLTTSLKFLEQNPALLSKAKEASGKIKEALSKLNGLKDQFQKAEEIKKFLKERKEFLKQQLNKFGFAKELKKLNKEAYYFSQQVNEYKEIIKDSKKAERKALELLAKTKPFRDFMRKNSQLASLFRMPSDPANPSSLAGLQTRAQVNSLIQQQISAGGPGGQQQFQQNIQQAQSQLQQLKDKILRSGGNQRHDDDISDFKPNNQKSKSFLKRLEYGTNIQTQKASNAFPVTSDIALSVGYKLNNKSIVGIGSSFKMGWGNSWRNIKISSQGLGLRSYLDYQLKGSLWISGGFEMNYRSEIREIAQLKDYSAWQQSGLLGISKTMPLKTKFFSKTKLQLLWDFLSYQQVPRAQPVLFRVGYTF